MSVRDIKRRKIERRRERKETMVERSNGPPKSALSTRENVWRRNADLIPRNSPGLRKAIKKKKKKEERERGIYKEKAHDEEMAANGAASRRRGMANGSTENYIKCDPSRAEAERSGAARSRAVREFRLI